MSFANGWPQSEQGIKVTKYFRTMASKFNSDFQGGCKQQWLKASGIVAGLFCS